MQLEKPDKSVKRSLVDGYQERNLGRLNPIIGLKRVDELKGWHKQIVVDDLGPIDLSCASTEVVPHGVDADILFALQTAFELQGAPAHRSIVLSVSQLCELSCLHPSAERYQRIRDGLERLTHVKYKAEACWGREGKKGWTFWSNTFGLVENLRYVINTQEERPSDFTPETLLHITLNEEVVRSMQSKHVRTLSYSTTNALAQPLSRMLYRMLEEGRPRTTDTYRLPLMAWAEHLGLIEPNLAAQTTNRSDPPPTKVIAPDRIRRALAPAHEDLIAVGYLKTASYEGRGSKSQVIYEFSSAQLTPINHEVLSLLTDYGVNPAIAEDQIRAKGEETIRCAVETLKARLEAGYSPRSKAALLIDILNKPGKYAESRKEAHKAPSTAGKSKKIHMEEPAEPPRVEQTAQVALGKALDDTPQHRQYRQQAIQAYLSGVVTVMELVKLTRSSDREIEQLLTLWQKRTSSQPLVGDSGELGSVTQPVASL